ncbi:MAG TPA: alpha/beta hydrolase [Polyangiales bacterium]|nr:alpha/beta hydrolase [Polyangiales bacterium]
MPKVRVNRDVELFYEEFGEGEPLLLIMGIGAQMIIWEEDFCRQLAAQGFRVIRFDNRDVGLSSRLDAAPVPNMNRMLLSRLRGKPERPPYTLDDMATDTFQLMDALGIREAHVVGLSLGGMIAQCMGLLHPERVKSLCIIMSAPGEILAAIPTPTALRTLMTRPQSVTQEGIVEHFIKTWSIFGADPHRTSPERLRVLGGLSFQRGINPRGFARQFAAIMAAPSRIRPLRTLRIPTVVLHGASDPLLPPHAGRIVAGQIPGARLFVIRGMGHDLGPSVWPFAIRQIVDNARRTLPRNAKRLGTVRALLRRPVEV